MYREAIALHAAIVPLPEVRLGVVGDVWDGLVARVGKPALGALHAGDFARYAFLLNRCVGESLLDVGCGAGVFLDAAARTDRFTRLAGADVTMSPLATATAWTPHIVDAERLPFAEGEFDTVTAQEMLEHQPDGKLERILAELRRVTARRLLITVPLCQTTLRGEHVQRFCRERLREVFPTARFTVLDKRNGRYPWVLVEEDR